MAKTKDGMSIGKKLMLILLLSCSLVGLGVFAGLAVQNIYSLFFALPSGILAFVLLLVVVFGFPLFVYYVTNAIYKLRIVAGHKYMAYHAIVDNMDSCVLRINCDGRHYKYKYCTLVGMKPKQVKNTPAVLIFIPDDVFIFPDNA